MNIRRLGKKPFRLVDQDLLRPVCLAVLQDSAPAQLKRFIKRKPAKRYLSLARVTENCGYKVRGIILFQPIEVNAIRAQKIG